MTDFIKWLFFGGRDPWEDYYKAKKEMYKQIKAHYEDQIEMFKNVKSSSLPK